MDTPGTDRVPFASSRLPWLDNVRTGMVVLVVVVHVAGVYESRGTWALFWIVDDPATSSLLDWLFVLLDVFVMPALFFVSGYVTPQSLSTKSAVGFLVAKARRLLVPWVVAVLTLIPLYKIIYLASRNIPQEPWWTYFHWEVLWGQNWLWFLPVLFMFDVVYLLLSLMRVTRVDIPLYVAVPFAILAGAAYGYGMNVLGLTGWTHTMLIDFQNERLLVCFLVFMLGSLCARRSVLATRPRSVGTHLAVGVIALGALVLYGFLGERAPAHLISATVDPLLVQLAYQLALYGMLYLILVASRSFLDRAGWLSRQLSANSYYVYVIHVIVLGGIAFALLNMKLPALCKFTLVTLTTFVVCNLIVTLGRKVFGTVFHFAIGGTRHGSARTNPNVA